MVEASQHEGRRFHLLEVIGAGAFGEVYLAEQDSGAGFRRKVAVKLLHADVARIPDAGRRMRDEARILGRLSHRHIVTVLDLIKLGDRWAIIMDYVPGADLEEVLMALEKAEEAFPPAAALEAGACVLRALDAAWRSDDGQGDTLEVVHRDIKPSNVRVTADGDLKVLDFGVARVKLDSREAQTKANGWIGTERYMAPERILMEGDTPAGDVYATIATVVELLLGEPLGRTPVLDERHAPFVEERLQGVRERLAERPDDLTDAIEAALRSGLHADPTERPSASELADTLEALARRCDGDTLASFCRRFVPEVLERLDRPSQPASGVLSEAGISDVQATLLPTELGAPTPVSTAPTQVAAGPSRAPWLLALGLFLALVTVIGGVVALGGAAAAFTWWPGTAEPLPTEAPAPSPPAPAAPAPVAAPEPEPSSEPEPPSEPESERPSEPEPVAPAPVAAPDPASPKPAPMPAPVPVDPDAPRIDRAVVSLRDASSVTVTCGDRAASGTASARLTDFPAGDCTVDAVYLGRKLTAPVRIERARAVTCTASGDTLTCR